MKVHDLKPRRGLDEAPQACRSRHRRQGRQDRRPRHQGPEGTQHHPGVVRGWPAAPGACGSRSSRGSTTRSASSTRRSTSTRSRSPGLDEISPRRCWARALYRKGALVKVLGRGELRPHRQGARILEVGRGGHHRCRRDRRGPFTSRSASVPPSTAAPTPTAWTMAEATSAQVRSLVPRLLALRYLGDHRTPLSPRRRRTPANLFRGASWRGPRSGNVLKVPDLRNKILFTILMLAIYRWCLTSAPRRASTTTWSPDQGTGASRAWCVDVPPPCSRGKALTQFALFSRLGITPYITSSIIMQILDGRDPEARSSGRDRVRSDSARSPSGRATSRSPSRCCSPPAWCSSSTTGGGLAVTTRTPTSCPHFAPFRVLLIVGDPHRGHRPRSCGWARLMTQNGIGNGMSIIIFTSVVSALPGTGSQAKAEAGWGGLVDRPGDGVR